MGSLLSTCITLEQSWRSTHLREATCHYRARCLSSSTSFRMKRRALPILSTHDGTMDSSVRTAGRLTSHGTFPRALGYFAAVIAAVIQASLPAPLWNARTRRSRCGSGRPTWSPAKRRACRLSSSNGNSCMNKIKMHTG